MIEREARIAEFWAGKLLTVPQAALDKLPLPAATVDFLRDIGLPNEPTNAQKAVQYNPSKTKVVNLNGIQLLTFRIRKVLRAILLVSLT